MEKYYDFLDRVQKEVNLEEFNLSENGMLTTERQRLSTIFKNDLSYEELRDFINITNKMLGRVSSYHDSIDFVEFLVINTHHKNNIRGAILSKIYNTYLDINSCFFLNPASRFFINDMFQNYLLPENDTDIELIGNLSSNGFVVRINSNLINPPESYEFNRILKFNRNTNSDNLYYEYLVGICVNHIKKYYPNFCYTYNLFQIDNTSVRTIEQSLRETRVTTLNTELIKTLNIGQNLESYKLEELDENITKFCRPNSNSGLVLMLEDIKSIPFISLLNVGDNEYLEGYGNISLTEKIQQILVVLYQVYNTLGDISNIFTHYDLHHGNILLYYKDNINFRIDYNNVTIYTKYIPVIIDYGRCYINCSIVENLEHINTNYIFDNICINKNCSNDDGYMCGTKNENGFNNIYRDKNFSPTIFNRYTSRHNNKSQDLRLIWLVSPILKKGAKILSRSYRGEANYISKLLRINSKFPNWANQFKNPVNDEIEDRYYVKEEENFIEFKKVKALAELKDVKSIKYYLLNLLTINNNEVINQLKDKLISQENVGLSGIRIYGIGREYEFTV
jgi:hypothetical protein